MNCWRTKSSLSGNSETLEPLGDEVVGRRLVETPPFFLAITEDDGPLGLRLSVTDKKRSSYAH